MRFFGDRPLAIPEAAARKLLEIVLAKDIDVGQYTYTGATNTAFLQAGAASPNTPPAGIMGSLRVGVDVPAPDEIKAMIEAAEGRSRRAS